MQYSGSGISLVAPVFETVGEFNTSTLTISDIRLAHAGDYECRVRDETDIFTLSVTEVGEWLHRYSLWVLCVCTSVILLKLSDV